MNDDIINLGQAGMIFKTASGHEIIGRALGLWGEYDDILGKVADLHYELVVEEVDEQMMLRIYGLVEHYVSSSRQKLLNDYWDRNFGGIKNVTPELAEVFQPLPSTYHLLYQVIQHYKIPRTYAQLHIHAMTLDRLANLEHSDSYSACRYSGLYLAYDKMLDVLYTGVETAPDAQ